MSAFLIQGSSFEVVHAQGYGDRGGATHEEAWHLWGQAGLVDGFSAAFRLADTNRDHRLDEQVRAPDALHCRHIAPLLQWSAAVLHGRDVMNILLVKNHS